MNSLLLAAYDYDDRDNLTSRNNFVELAGLIFTTIFTIEFVLKTFAMGFIIHKNAYLRDGWNWIDFVVVVIG
jgi:voltage-dependent calcium channel L type alpha-1D